MIGNSGALGESHIFISINIIWVYTIIFGGTSTLILVYTDIVSFSSIIYGPRINICGKQIVAGYIFSRRRYYGGAYTFYNLLITYNIEDLLFG